MLATKDGLSADKACLKVENERLQQCELQLRDQMTQLTIDHEHEMSQAQEEWHDAASKMQEAHDAEVNSLKVEVSASKRLLAASQATRKELDDEILRLREEAELARVKVEQTKAGVDAASEQLLNAKEASLQVLEQQKAAFLEDIAAARIKEQDLLSEIDRLAESHAEAKVQLQKTRLDAEAELKASHASQVSALNRQLSAMEAAHEHALAALQSSLDEAEALRDEQAAQSCILEKRVEESHRRVKELSEEIAAISRSHSEEISILKREMSDAVSKARTSQASALAAVKEQCSALDREKSSLADEVDNLKDSSAAASAKGALRKSSLQSYLIALWMLRGSLQLPQKACDAMRAREQAAQRSHEESVKRLTEQVESARRDGEKSRSAIVELETSHTEEISKLVARSRTRGAVAERPRCSR